VTRRSRVGTLLPACCAALSAGCGTSYTPHLRLGQGLPYPNALSLSRDEAEHDAVILVDERWVTHHAADATTAPSSTEEVRRAIYLVNEAGRTFATVQIPYSPDVPIVLLEARSILPDGTVLPVSDSAILDSEYIRTGGEGGRATRVKTFAFPRAGKGAIVEYRYLRRHPGWIMSLEYRVSAPVPVREVRLTAHMPQVSIRYAAGGFGAPSIRGQQFTWRLRNVEPPSREAFGLPERLRAPFVSISVDRIDFWYGGVHIDVPVYKTWGNVAAPIWRAVEDVIRTPLFGLTAGARDDGTKAHQVWQRVQARIDDRAWFSRRDGRPRNALEIYTSGMGTSDERALVMLAALRGAGVPAMLLLLPGDEDEDVKKDFPTPEPLSDVLVCVPTGTSEPLVLDPACLGCAPGELAVPHQGRSGILITGAGSATPGLTGFESPAGAGVRVKTRRFTTALSPVSEPTSEITAEVIIHERGLVARRGQWTARGALAAMIRHYFAQHPVTEAKRRDVMRKKYLDGVEGGRILVTGLDTPGAPIRVHLEDVLLERGGFVRAGPWTLVPVHALQRDDWIADLSRKGRGPVHFDVAPGFSRKIRVLVPAGRETVSLPAPRRIESRLAIYDLKVESEEGAVVLNEELSLRQRTFRGGEEEQLAAFLAEVQEQRRRAIVLRETPRMGLGGAQGAP